MKSTYKTTTLATIVAAMLSITSQANANDSGLYARIDGGISSPMKSGKTQFKNSGLYSVGVGYQFHPVLRADLNLQTRQLKLDNPNKFSVKKIDSKALMLNIYANIIETKYVNPYFTAGIGYGSNKAGNSSTTANGISIDNQGTKTNNFIWNVGAVAEVNLTKNTMLDFTYRFVNLGHAKYKSTTSITGFNPTSTSNIIKSIKTHDFTIGLIYKF